MSRACESHSNSGALRPLVHERRNLCKRAAGVSGCGAALPHSHRPAVRQCLRAKHIISLPHNLQPPLRATSPPIYRGTTELFHRRGATLRGPRRRPGLFAGFHGTCEVRRSSLMPPSGMALETWSVSASLPRAREPISKGAVRACGRSPQTGFKKQSRNKGAETKATGTHK